MPNKTNLFALVEDDQASIRRIPLKADIGAELTQFFASQQSDFVENKQQITFSGSYNVGSDKIFTITDYPLPDVIGSALSNPLPCQLLNLNNETHRIKALFTGIWSNNNNIVNFQIFDSGKLLSKGWTLIGAIGSNERD